MTHFRLRCLNLSRWIREYAISWGVLSLIYSWTVTLILQPILERALKTEIGAKPLWIATAFILLIPGAFEYLPLPPVVFGRGKLTFMPSGIFGEKIWSRFGGTLVPLYLRHELRRGATWLVICLTAALAGILPPGKYALWVLIAQLPVQRALFSISSWRTLAVSHPAREGGDRILWALWISQFLQAAIAWGAVGLAGFYSFDHWWALGPAVLGAILSASMVALEGDAGRPWMVNFFSLAAGTVGGYACLASPWFLLLILYFCKGQIASTAKRLMSVEHLDEDRIIP